MALVALVALVCVGEAAGLYGKGTNVVQLTPENFQQVFEDANVWMVRHFIVSMRGPSLTTTDRVLCTLVYAHLPLWREGGGRGRGRGRETER